MINIKKIAVFSILILLTSCGYTPLLNSNNSDFYIGNLTLNGDRQINNYISTNLKKYKNKKENAKIYDIEITSEYIKNITNKDNSGNPKNYNITTKVNIKILSDGAAEKIRDLKRSFSFSAQNKKITENQIESDNKKNLSKLLAQDIIFLLRNQ